jgi:16S rRNA (guanine527-N7)-methyltransferase
MARPETRNSGQRPESSPESLNPDTSGTPAETVAPPPPPAAAEAFGDRLPLACRFADILVSDAVVRGLVGPREAPRIWDRHLLNCVAVRELIPSGAFVIDIGSGAGLPGIVLAVARPDLQITLVESLARRTTFLTETAQRLDLRGVKVVRARAEECVGVLPPADVVTARAVAPLDRLAAWALPLAALGGRLLAIKGDSAATEIAEYGAAVERMGGGPPIIRECGSGFGEHPVTVVEVVRERVVARARPRKQGRGRAGR